MARPAAQLLRTKAAAGGKQCQEKLTKAGTKSCKKKADQSERALTPKSGALVEDTETTSTTSDSDSSSSSDTDGDTTTSSVDTDSDSSSNNSGRSSDEEDESLADSHIEKLRRMEEGEDLKKDEDEMDSYSSLRYLMKNNTKKKKKMKSKRQDKSYQLKSGFFIGLLLVFGVSTIAMVIYDMTK